jgi:ribose 5-phosphate isomerase B
MKIAIGADHAGFALKEALKNRLLSANFEVEDFGADSKESVDYPDFGVAVARAVSEGNADRGILICHTGIGMSIVANKVDGVRAALCRTEEDARLCRRHNDANVLALSGSFTPPELAGAIVDAFLETGFESGGRHERRVDKIHQLTGK